MNDKFKYRNSGKKDGGELKIRSVHAGTKTFQINFMEETSDGTWQTVNVVIGAI